MIREGVGEATWMSVVGRKLPVGFEFRERGISHSVHDAPEASAVFVRPAN